MLTKPALHREIEGYASAASVNQGQTIRLYVNTTASRYRLNVYRMGWYDGLGAEKSLLPHTIQDADNQQPYREPDSGIDRMSMGRSDTVGRFTSSWPSGPLSRQVDG